MTTDVLSRANKILARIRFHGCDTLVFIRPDGALDSVPSWSPRAVALVNQPAAGFRVVGTYRQGVTAEQIAADAREALV